MPMSCLITDCGDTPLLNARDISLPIASFCEPSHPPAFPMLQNTSNGLPFSSSFTVTYRSPQDVLILFVTPVVVLGLGLGSMSG